MPDPGLTSEYDCDPALEDFKMTAMPFGGNYYSQIHTQMLRDQRKGDISIRLE